LISEFGGLSKVMPVFATFFMIVTLSSIGLPGLNGFVGEFLILLGAFKASTAPVHSLSILYVVFAATGVIFAAVYMLWMFQRVMFGEVTNPKNENLSDLSKRELVVLIPVVIFIFWIGVYPKTFLKPMEATVNGMIQRVEQRVNVKKTVQEEKMSFKVLKVVESQGEQGA
jgi:NADH-quinone oxidoreductase subunit M